ncbi:hypothetical protein GMSM_00540 [Geomonas sp. Red276]
MEKEPCNYRDYFHPGQRAVVEVNVEGGKVFNDGAVVTAVDDGHIGLRLSWDKVPLGAQLHREAPLVVRVGGIGYGYSCKVVLLDDSSEELRAGFAGPVVPEDSREFFRLGTEIPVVLFNVTAGTAEENGFGGLRVAGKGGVPRIVNISGGGLRTETEMAMAMGDIVYATFHLPLTEPKVVPVVAQVVHSEVLERDGVSVVSSGLSFMHINERDRDAIVRYVCKEEINRIRNCRKQMRTMAD